MRRKIGKNTYLVWRCLLLVSVLSGIFFSSGEGVQLLPFPQTGQTAGGDPHDLRTAKIKTYNLSVHNSSRTSGSYKFQKSLGKDFVPVEISAGGLDPVEFYLLPTRQNHYETRLFDSSVHLIRRNNRAPPLV